MIAGIEILFRILKYNFVWKERFLIIPWLWGWFFGSCFFPTIIHSQLNHIFYKIHFLRNIIFLWWGQLQGNRLPGCTFFLDSDLHTYNILHIPLGLNIRKRTLDFFEFFPPPQQADLSLKHSVDYHVTCWG